GGLTGSGSCAPRLPIVSDTRMSRARGSSALALKRKAQERVLSFQIIPRRRPTLPRSLPRSTIGAGGLNGRVRNGNGGGPSAKVTGKAELAFSCQPSALSRNWRLQPLAES